MAQKVYLYTSKHSIDHLKDMETWESWLYSPFYCFLSLSLSLPHTHACTHTHTRTHARTHARTHTHTHTHTHAHNTHTHTHTHTHRVKSLMAEESSSPSSSSSSSSYEQPSLLPSAGGWPLESPYQPHSMATWNPAAGRNGMGPGTSDPLAALEAGILQDLMVEVREWLHCYTQCCVFKC